MAQIHSQAVVEDGAIVGNDVRIGPFSYVGPHVKLGHGVQLHPHVSIIGETKIGDGTVVFPGAVLGGPPQSVRHGGGRSELEIGKNCIIREGATVNAGTDSDRGITTIGDRCYLMTQSHVAHDCDIGNDVTIVNNVMLAGHCQVGDGAMLSGGCAVFQFSRIGRLAFVAALSGVVGDVIPFGLAIGHRAHLDGLNLIGMKRAKFERKDVRVMREAYKMLFDRKHTIEEATISVRDTFGDSQHVVELLDFIKNRRKRALVTPEIIRSSAADVG